MAEQERRKNMTPEELAADDARIAAIPRKTSDEHYREWLAKKDLPKKSE